VTDLRTKQQTSERAGKTVFKIAAAQTRPQIFFGPPFLRRSVPEFSDVAWVRQSARSINTAMPLRVPPVPASRTVTPTRAPNQHARSMRNAASGDNLLVLLLASSIFFV